METVVVVVVVVVVGGDVEHRWLCLDLVGRMARGGDGEAWLQPPPYVFRVFRLAFT